MEQHVQAFVGLGANVGAARSALERAITALAVLPGAALTGVSRLYRTRPVGPVEQGDYLNAVAGLLVPAGARPQDGAMALLVALKGLERAMGRVRRERWGPREIDLDLLLFGHHAMRVERQPDARSLDWRADGGQWLEVPHPSASERAFVLAPLADLVPDLVPPGWGVDVAAALRRTLEREGTDAVEPVGEWDGRAGHWRDLPG
jgi:2-amino-4-hydroxy-6-hydroxymethyldihydropteridine diphosphokinase